MLTIKQKVWSGTAFLFLLLLITGGIGVYYTAVLRNDSKEVLKDNYNSLVYCYRMQQQLDSIATYRPGATQRFETALALQESNITEPGEDAATHALRKAFNTLKTGDTSSASQQAVRSCIQRVLYLNMNAIHTRNEKAEATANNAFAIILGMVGIILIIGLLFSARFPSILLNPIRAFSAAIDAISNRNYTHRINLSGKDEFGALAGAFNHMATRIGDYENSNLGQILFEKSRAEAVINSLKDPSIGIDRNGIVLFANVQALQLFGLSVGDVAGKPIATLLQRYDWFHVALNKDAVVPFTINIDGHTNYFTREIIELSETEGGSKVIVLHNITSFKELDAAKTNFIATISHELKTPLAASGLSLKLLSDERIGALSAEQKGLVGNLQGDNRRMLKILGELLNIAQVEAGHIRLNLATVTPGNIVHNAIETVAAAARDAHIIIQQQLPDNLPTIYADAEKTTWVLNNLLVNAIRYAPRNSAITVAAHIHESGVIFSVADEGPGIPEQYLSRIFDRYFQVPGMPGGTGLGLAISKEIIEAQGGTMDVDSTTGKGSIFRCIIPIAQNPLPPR